jgi:hypothetical protein
MESSGEEMKMRELFSELKLVDEQTAPSFAGVWNRAQARTVRTSRAFNLSFVAATALLVCALVSMAWWMSRTQPRHDLVAVATSTGTVAPAPVTTGGDITTGGDVTLNPRTGVQRQLVAKKYQVNDKSRTIRVAAARSQAVQIAMSSKALRDAKAIDSWQSPTAGLLDSSSGELLKSLPSLNQNTDELKSFLPSQPK